jgi:D-beta-D-heptose 7-phosphate kinase/D-beta-D-heptose 1-phosphate adenosyltransferase
MITVWTNGCFDILHPGHMELFKIAKSLGDRLIVGIDEDQKVSNDKGSDRPINSLSFRKSMLESNKYIDVVVPFGSRKELENLIELYSPDILLVGGDWRNGDVVGRQFAKEVRFLDRVGDYSTTDIIRRINEIRR